MIEEIATDVSNKLISSVPSSDFNSLVGMRAHMENMDLLLRLDSNEVRMIGIWGPSGIGKSTIARSLFSQHSPDFQLSVFMENIKREYPRPCFDRYSAQLQLQNKFLSLILNQNDVTIHHLGVAQDRLKDKKVLVVLDDVDQSAQLDALAKELWWFGPGSRVIVTTQDKRILKAHPINLIYEVGFPHDDEALEIFCINAFGQKSPYDGFGDLALEVTKLVGKLPLGLSVVGSYFKGLSKEEWEHELPREIVRKQAPYEPGQRQFLVDDEDICKVLSDGTLGSRSVIGIDIKLGKELKVSDRAFERMSSVQFLNLSCDFSHPSPYVLESLICLPRELKLLDWTEFPMTCLPSNFNPEFLVVINMSFSKLEKLWEGNKASTNISLSKNLYTSSRDNVLWSLPNLSTATNLLKLDLRDCSSLMELPFSIGNLINLENLNITGCSSLVELPFSIGNITTLKELELDGCSSLVELPFSIGNMANLKKLELNGCSSLVELPFSIGNMTNLEKLNLDRCSSLLPSSIGNLHNLKQLNLRGCSKLKALPVNINMKSLDELHLGDCSSLKSFPEISTNIRVLKLKRTAIEEIPQSIRSWSRLERLHMSYSENLGKSQHAFDLITELHLSDTRIQEVSPWVKEMSRLHKLVT
ncbi:unnamed protein product [Brassica oleracea]